jgi:hypothetical protein
VAASAKLLAAPQARVPGVEGRFGHPFVFLLDIGIGGGGLPMELRQKRGCGLPRKRAWDVPRGVGVGGMITHLSFASISAPAARSLLMLPSRPKCAARWSGVSPFCGGGGTRWQRS